VYVKPYGRGERRLVVNTKEPANTILPIDGKLVHSTVLFLGLIANY
jgi:hypothetical protein